MSCAATCCIEVCWSAAGCFRRQPTVAAAAVGGHHSNPPLPATSPNQLLPGSKHIGGAVQIGGERHRRHLQAQRVVAPGATRSSAPLLQVGLLRDHRLPGCRPKEQRSDATVGVKEIAGIGIRRCLIFC
ncbi:uncharacterized protein LOC124677757 [Lolium rigidum]|uniref:uncharacterized protein LOC124677757 n=1 Tax=Lolium rigidum TaxID=89674 RepID=UPI001F5DA121|nr:uncharacterized protein LOC124677757 [Lolium rigidum]